MATRNFQIKNGITVGTNTLVSSGNSIGIGLTNPTQSLHVSGNVRLNNSLYDFNNNAGTTGQVLTSTGTGTSWGTPSGVATSLSIGTGGTIMISTGSSIGIGTSTPSQKLHVVGNSYVTGARYDSNNSAGTTGQVLSSRGTGTSWITIVTSNSTLTFGQYLTGGSFNGSAPVTIGIAATSVSTGNSIVVRNSSGNFSANIITASLNGNANTATTATNVSGGSVSATTGTFSDVLSDPLGNVRNIPVNTQSTAYTLASSDSGKCVVITGGSGITVPPDIFSAGNVINIFNNTGAEMTIYQGTGVTLYLSGTALTGNRILSQRGFSSLFCISNNEFVFTGSGVS